MYIWTAYSYSDLWPWKYFYTYCIFKINDFKIDSINDKKSSDKYYFQM